jgi:hypothetical protein
MIALALVKQSLAIDGRSDPVIQLMARMFDFWVANPIDKIL